MNTNPNRPGDDRTRGRGDDPANRDPITGAPGAHPVGTGIGAAAAGAAGAAIGAAAGPVGAVAGAVVGAVAGGLGGKAAAEAVDPTVEDAYWQKSFTSRPYASGSRYDDYRPAYQLGWESASKYRGQEFSQVEPSIQTEWGRVRGQSQLSWDRAKAAVRDAWDRVTGPRRD